VQQMHPFCISIMLSLTPTARVPAVLTRAASMFTCEGVLAQGWLQGGCGRAHFCHVVHDNGGIFRFWMLEKVLQEGGLTRAKEATQNSDGHGFFGFLSKRFVAGCGSGC
jgi:hypothetical protein